MLFGERMDMTVVNSPSFNRVWMIHVSSFGFLTLYILILPGNLGNPLGMEKGDSRLERIGQSYVPRPAGRSLVCYSWHCQWVISSSSPCAREPRLAPRFSHLTPLPSSRAAGHPACALAGCPPNPP